jgi:hypothetical protein
MLWTWMVDPGLLPLLSSYEVSGSSLLYTITMISSLAQRNRENKSGVKMNLYF